MHKMLEQSFTSLFNGTNENAYCWHNSVVWASRLSEMHYQKPEDFYNLALSPAIVRAGRMHDAISDWNTRNG